MVWRVMQCDEACCFYGIVGYNVTLLSRHNGRDASQMASLAIVYTTVYSDEDQRNHESSASLAFAREFTGHSWIPAQMASNAENVSIWWLYVPIIQMTIHKYVTHNHESDYGFWFIICAVDIYDWIALLTEWLIWDCDMHMVKLYKKKCQL